jgi:hypothetical protein
MAELSTQQKRVWAVALTGIVLSLGIVSVLTVVWGGRRTCWRCRTTPW